MMRGPGDGFSTRIQQTSRRGWGQIGSLGVKESGGRGMIGRRRGDGTGAIACGQLRLEEGCGDG